MSAPLRILFVSPEVQPFAKTGGLGDISRSLPSALKKMGHDVRVIMPKYKSADRFESAFIEIDIPPVDVTLGKAKTKGFLYEGTLESNIPIYFVRNDPYFSRENLYSESYREYPDNAERFIFFCRAVLEACKKLDFKPDIIHGNDWQTGLIFAYLKSVYAEDKFFKDTGTVFSIHNLGYQGNFSAEDYPLTGLPPEMFNMKGIEFYGGFSFLKAGLLYADMLTTVSQTYAQDILTPENGFRMEGVLRQRQNDLHGIINGANYEDWDPLKDTWLKKKFGPKNLAGKAECKKDLAQKLSLKPGKNKPVLCMVTRLSHQKGIDLIMDGFDKLLAKSAAFVLLGSGEPAYEDFFLKQAKRFPGKFFCKIGFDEKLAHQIIAGSDILLMPSIYEPCGLTQLHAMKYGTVPLVRSVGGLKDTVTEFDTETGKGTGFKFLPFELKYFLKTFNKAESAFKNKKLWDRLVANGMKENFDWNQTAKRYVQVYLKTLTK